jgi:hypothetical protein
MVYVPVFQGNLTIGYRIATFEAARLYIKATTRTSSVANSSEEKHLLFIAHVLNALTYS